LVLSATALTTLPAQAQDVLAFDGLGKVKIGMSPSQAAQALGAKLKPMDPEMDASCWTTERADDQAPGIWYMVQDGHIVRIDIGIGQDGLKPAIATAKGIGLGATEEDVVKAYGKGLKISPHPYGGPQDHYLLLDAKPGKVGLLFEVEGGKVTTFRAGQHPALDLSEGCS
jgi:hypothetical protein